MEEMKKQKGVQSLKWFLIQRFLFIMLFVFVSEELLNMGYRVWLGPFLTETMHIQQLSVTTGEGSVMLLMLQMVLLSASTLLPEGISRWVQAIIGKNMGDGLRIDIISPVLEGVKNQRIIELYQVAIIIIFLGLLFVTILPYLIAAWWYYRIVSKKVKELLLEEQEQKKEYDKKRNLLLSDIAHDIKTPITTVCGYARALADDVVAEEERKKEYLQAIYAKSMRMSDLITLLFEYVKLDSSGFSLHKEMADLGEVLRENVALLYSDFEEKEMQLEIEIPERKFPYEMDKIQMGRAITNILTNAVKYNEKGIKVCISLDESYTIRIADNGEPIEDSLAEHIFEPFSRGDKARSTKGGNGLGLSISSKIVQMHGGELTLERQCSDGCVKAFLISLAGA